MCFEICIGKYISDCKFIASCRCFISVLPSSCDIDNGGFYFNGIITYSKPICAAFATQAAMSDIRTIGIWILAGEGIYAACEPAILDELAGDISLCLFSRIALRLRASRPANITSSYLILFS